jgi:hypothetical protein
MKFPQCYTVYSNRYPHIDIMCYHETVLSPAQKIVRMTSSSSICDRTFARVEELMRKRISVTSINSTFPGHHFCNLNTLSIRYRIRWDHCLSDIPEPLISSEMHSISIKTLESGSRSLTRVAEVWNVTDASTSTQVQYYLRDHNIWRPVSHWQCGTLNIAMLQVLLRRNDNVR